MQMITCSEWGKVSANMWYLTYPKEFTFQCYILGNRLNKGYLKVKGTNMKIKRLGQGPESTRGSDVWADLGAPGPDF